MLNIHKFHRLKCEDLLLYFVLSFKIVFMVFMFMFVRQNKQLC